MGEPGAEERERAREAELAKQREQEARNADSAEELSRLFGLT